MQLKNWPAKRRIEDCDCWLNVGGAVIDLSRPTTPASYSGETSAYYMCRRRWWPWARPQLRGPHYTWARNGQLLERVYVRGPKDYLVYQVDRSGRLARFLDRKHATTEYFDVDGVLIAGEYAPLGLDWRAEGYHGGTVSVWLGRRITHHEFMGKAKVLFIQTASRF